MYRTLGIVLPIVILFQNVCAGLEDEELFCKVVVGTESKIEFLAGFKKDAFLIYRNGTSKSEPESYPMKDGQLETDVKVPVFHYSKASFQITGCYKHVETEPDSRTSMMLHGIIRDGKNTFKQYCDATLKPISDELSLAHFDGPLTVGIQKYNWQPIPIEFVIGGKPTDIRVNVDTADKEKGCWTTIESGANKLCNFPTGVRPVATIEFPSNDPESPIVKKYELDQFC